MTNWFDEEIRESIAKEAAEQETPVQDVDKMKEALSSLGFDVSGINITAVDKKLEDNIGKRAYVKNSIIVASNVLIKTNYNLYRISQVVLPKGYIGVIGGVENGKYTIDFDANLPIQASDVVEGYDGSNLTYPLDKFELADNEVQIL